MGRSSARAGQSVRALVVDDLVENRMVLAEMLSEAGCTVTTAADGRSALKLAATETFDIAFIDILMPDLDGSDLATHIRRPEAGGASHRSRLVAVTASAFTHERDRWLACGFDDVIAKPVLCSRIYQVLSSLLGVELIPAPADEPLEQQRPAPSAAIVGDLQAISGAAAAHHRGGRGLQRHQSQAMH